MATILEFRNAGRAVHLQARAHRPSLPGGEIVLFPGVRYEYDAAPAEPQDAKPKRKHARKRDKLVINERAE